MTLYTVVLACGHERTMTKVGAELAQRFPQHAICPTPGCRKATTTSDATPVEPITMQTDHEEEPRG